MIHLINANIGEKNTLEPSVLVALQSENLTEKTANKMAENFNIKIKSDHLDFEYLRGFHPTFQELILSDQEWDYLEKVKWSFMEDPSKSNLEKTIGELTSNQVYLAEPILYLFGKVLKLQQKIDDQTKGTT